MNTSEQMGIGATYDPQLIKTRFVQAIQQTLNNLSDDNAVTVKSKLIHMLGTWNPAQFASAEMLTEISQFVFTSEPLRDWVLSTKFVFFMNVSSGAARDFAGALLGDLAIAASEDMDAEMMLSPQERQEYSNAVDMPEPLRQDLPTVSQARTVFAANTWMIVLLLLFAFVDLEDAIFKSPQEPSTSRQSKIPS